MTFFMKLAYNILIFSYNYYNIFSIIAKAITRRWCHDCNYEPALAELPPLRIRNNNNMTIMMAPG